MHRLKFIHISFIVNGWFLSILLMTTWDMIMTFIFVSNGIKHVNIEYITRGDDDNYILSNGIIHVNWKFSLNAIYLL